MTLTKNQKITWGLLAIGVAIAVVFGIRDCSQGDKIARGFITPGGGFVPPTAGGASSGNSTITTNSAGLLAGTGSSGSPLTATLSVTAPVVGTGSSGSPLNVTLTGGTCANGRGVTSVAADGTATCGDVGMNQYTGTHLEWIDEWLFPSCGTGSPCGSVYAATQTGASAQLTQSGSPTRPGLIQVATGSTSTGLVSIFTGATAVGFSAGNWSYEWTGGFPTLSTAVEGYAYYVGFGDSSTTVDQVDGCGFLYDERNVATNGANSGNTHALECLCASNSTRTVFLINGSGNSDESFALGSAVLAAYTAPDTNIRTLKVQMTGTTRAEFYVNGTKVCNINTNIPSTSARITGALMLMLKNVGSTGRTAIVDRTRLAVDLTAARSP